MRRAAFSIDTGVLAGLTLAAAALAAALAAAGRSTWLEAASFVTGAVCVWLTVKESVWNFPVGLVNVATFCVVFFRAQLYADAGLQIVYFVLGLVGWYLWLHGGARHTTLHVGRASFAECLILAIVAAALTFALWRSLRLVGGSTSFWDALTTSISLAAQWLLNRKRLESWIGWILVDTIYVPLYLYKELYLTAVLYAVFLVMAVIGFFEWRATWRAQGSATCNPELLPVGSRA